ncbi:MAG: AMP-binding protein [Noviherbaspirillum sp.]
MTATAHVDTFARDRLPPRDQWPELLLAEPFLQYPERLNAAHALLHGAIARGYGERPAILAQGVRWSYADLLDRAGRIARVLRDDLGMVPGNRVLLRGANTPMMAASVLAVWLAGGIVVPTMPMLRAPELATVLERAEVNLALCAAGLADEMETARAGAPALGTVVYFDDAALLGHEAAMAQDGGFDAVETAADDVCLIAFTSGTTGKPKGTMHFHRDLLAAADCFPRAMLQPTADDIYTGTPPLAFTFGLGAMLLFPLRYGAATVLVAKPTPAALLQAIADFDATICSTAPTFYRQMTPLADPGRLATLRHAVSAGEPLPLATREAWERATGVRMTDGIGSTEMLHIFISASGEDIRPGATGKPVPGYSACILDEEGRALPPNTVGRLAVKGPTGCRYLDDTRQRDYVQDGWNVTGDAYEMDEDGYFWYRARLDDMIVSSGYNIAGPEVEAALLRHPAVAECAVVGWPDGERGQIVKAFVVPREMPAAEAALVDELQDFVRRAIAPYKYPRAIEFRTALPRTETGKLQRYKLRAGAV